MNFESLFVPLSCGSQLHVMSVSSDSPTHSVPILAIHGIMEDGRIFYHRSGKGLAIYLAKHGYQVYVADLRGMGLSTPKISKDSNHGQTETIVTDIPALINFVSEHSGSHKLHLCAHSWGGVNLNACMIRFPQIAKKVLSAVYFGSKRRIRVRNIHRLFNVELFWNRVGLWVGKHKGYLPAKTLKFGSENETNKTHIQCVEWIKQNAWIDSDDGFNYGKEAKNAQLPPIYYLAAIKDMYLGHQNDVKLFMHESQGVASHFQLLSKKNGNAKDYDHVDMLTAPEAVRGHFPQVIKWIEKHT